MALAGGELGRDWHAQGVRERRANGLADLSACLDYLVKQGFSLQDRIVLHACSAGGVLAGNLLASRPQARPPVTAWPAC